MVHRVILFYKDLVFQALFQNPQQLYMGDFQWGSNHDQLRQPIFYQFQSNGTSLLPVIIGPNVIQQADFISPMPTWKERQSSYSWGSKAEIVVTVFNIVCIGITVISMVWIICYWDSKVVLGSLPPFLMFALVGGFLSYGSIFAWMPGFIFKAACHIRVWFLGMGFIIMLGSIVAKSWKVLRILSASANFERVIVPNLFVLYIVLTLAAIETIFLVFFSVAFNYSIAVIEPNPNKPILNYKVCDSRPGPWKTIAVSALCVYQGALILAAFCLGYKLRKVPLRVFDESKIIGFSMYNVGFFAIILLILELVLGNTEREILFVARSFLVMAAALITVGTLMSHKLYMQYFKDVGP